MRRVSVSVITGLLCSFVMSNCSLPNSTIDSIATATNPIEHRRAKTDSKGLQLTPDSKGLQLTPDSKGLQLTPDSKGPQLTPDSKGLQLTPDSKGPQLTPDSKGPQLTPDSKGPQLTPDSKGPQLTPDSKGPQLTPDSKGSRLSPDSKGPKRITLPPLGITIPPLGFTFPPRGITIPPLGFTFPPRGFSAVSGRVTLPSNILAPSRAADFKVQDASINLQQLFENMTIYANGQPLAVPAVFQDIQLDTNQQIRARFYLEQVPLAQNIVLTLKSKQNPEITYLSAWIPHSNHQVMIQDMNTRSTALTMMHEFSSQYSPLDILATADLISLEIHIIDFLATQQAPRILKTNQFKTIIKGLATSIIPGSAQPQGMTTLPSQVEVPVQSTIPLQTHINLSNGSQLTGIRWSIEDPQVAMIDTNGIIRPIHSGQTKMKASIPGFPEFTQEVQVMVTALKEISLSPSVINLSAKDDDYSIHAIVKSDNQTLFTVDPAQIKWSSENPDVVSVDQNGRVTAKVSTGFSQIKAQLHHYPEISGTADVRIITHGFSSGEKSNIVSSPPPAGGVVNQPPVITSLNADINPISGSGYPTKLVCSATDADNTLVDASFSWSCDGGCGTFNRTDSNTVYWTAPVAPGGPYTIRVNVSDGVNPAVTSTVSMTVLTGTTNLSGTGGYF